MSSISLAIGIPTLVRSQNSCLDTRKPLLILNVSLISGSLIRPFHPTVVLGFSRYARMMMQRSWLSFAEISSRRCAYSSAVTGSWMEQGPTMTNSRSSCWVMIRTVSRRPLATVKTVLSDCSFRVSGMSLRWLVICEAIQQESQLEGAQEGSKGLVQRLRSTISKSLPVHARSWLSPLMFSFSSTLPSKAGIFAMCSTLTRRKARSVRSVVQREKTKRHQPRS